MKKATAYIIISFIGIVLIIGLFFGLRSTWIIDIWEINSKSHTFGYWESATDKWSGEKPNRVVILPIEKNGNYPCNPESTDFNKWLAASITDTKMFTKEGYNKVVCSKE